MTPGAVRRIVFVIGAAGIAGMIVGSIADNNGAAMTAGIITAIAVLCLIVATAVTGGAVTPSPDDAQAEALAEDLEHRINRLAGAGADEQQVRLLVGTAVKLGELRR